MTNVLEYYQKYYYGKTDCVPIQVADELYDYVAQLEATKDEYIVLLEAMKIRDPNLDPIWMMQYAEEKLKALGGE